MGQTLCLHIFIFDCKRTGSNNAKTICYVLKNFLCHSCWYFVICNHRSICNLFATTTITIYFFTPFFWSSLMNEFPSCHTNAPFFELYSDSSLIRTRHTSFPSYTYVSSNESVTCVISWSKVFSQKSHFLTWLFPLLTPTLPHLSLPQQYRHPYSHSSSSQLYQRPLHLRFFQDHLQHLLFILPFLIHQPNRKPLGWPVL